mgnify:CR=1 FL=1
MKQVIEINQVKQVPDDHIECSVCGKYQSPDLYRNEGETRQSRTNCKTCYEAPSESWDKIRAEVDKYKASRQALEDQLAHQSNLLHSSMPVEELIQKLQALPKGSRILMTQEGYYAQGKFADIHGPVELKDKGFYSIGHSNQNY